MSWSQPAGLAPFPTASPFDGLPVPEEVRINRQVLAEPTADLAAHTWASLADGTPLVTETTIGAGRVVLFHVTANADWSNLPLSGLFVEHAAPPCCAVRRGRSGRRHRDAGAGPDAGRLRPAD